MNKVLLVAFRNSSAEKLVSYCGGDKLIVENDKIKCAAELESVIKQGKYSYIFCFGQRPNIKDKVHIETQAKIGNNICETNLDCEKLQLLFEQNGITAKLSHNAGTSYCNHIYYSGLASLNNMKTAIVFVHIPFEKNITAFADFSQKVNKAVNEYAK